MHIGSDSIEYIGCHQVYQSQCGASGELVQDADTRKHNLEPQKVTTTYWQWDTLAGSVCSLVVVLKPVISVYCKVF